MAWITPTTWPQDKSTPIFAKHLNIISDDLNYLKGQVDTLVTTRDQRRNEPVLRICGMTSSTQTRTGRQYITGGIVVFLNGRLLRPTTDWTPTSTADGQINFTFTITSNDFIVVWDWTP